jgi:tellurite resistance protein TehA-like permease
MKLSTLAWLAFFSICLWWLCSLSQAMFSAHYAYYDLKNSQAKEMLFGK